MRNPVLGIASLPPCKAQASLLSELPRLAGILIFSYHTFQRANNKGADQTVDVQDGLLVYLHATKSGFLAMWAHIIMLLALQYGYKKIFSLRYS